MSAAGKLLIMLLCAACFVLRGAAIGPRCVVVTENLVTAPEKSGAQILADTLGKIFSCKIKIIDQKDYDGKSDAVILSSSKMQNEEWCIESISPNRVRISGTPPRGVFYGAVEFLELFGQCRYFDVDFLSIPRKKSITVPEGRKFRRKPYFSFRSNSGGFWAHDGMAARRVWNKQNGGYTFWGDYRIDAEEGATLYQYREPRFIGPSGHSFYFWSKNFPKNKDEFFSLNSSGRRERATSPAGPGQLCLSNPEVRKLVKKNVLAEIAKSNANALKKGLPKSSLVELSHNDNGNFCVCKNCKALFSKYKSFSGVMLDFVNDIASAAPDITFQTFAYTLTENPPVGIKPAPNVMVRIALLGHELMSGPCDTMRPLSSPTNAKARSIYESWHRLTDNLSVWLYHRRFARLFAVPAANFWYMGENFRYLKRIGVKRVNIESEFNDLREVPFPNSFYALHIYLSEKLLDDPDQDDKFLINEFMERFYGPAAGEMKQFAAYLKKRTEEEKRPLGTVPEHDLTYLDREFLTVINSFITSAMKKAGKDRKLQERIELEYIPLDFAILNMWERIPDLERSLGLSKTEIFTRLEKALETAYRKYFVPELYKPGKLATSRKAVKAHLEELRNPIPTPPELAQRELRQFAAGTIPVRSQIVSDPEALRGKAQYLGPEYPRHPKFNPQLHLKPMEFGIYDYAVKKNVVKKVFAPEEIHQDGKYHLYYIGRTIIPPPTHKPRFFGHWSWAFNGSPALNSLYRAQDDKARYDIFVSLKFKGPAYVKNSLEANGIWLDRIIFAKAVSVRDSEKAVKK